MNIEVKYTNTVNIKSTQENRHVSITENSNTEDYLDPKSGPSLCREISDFLLLKSKQQNH